MAETRESPHGWQVHVWVRSPITGLSEWKAVRPAGSERPYVYATRAEAERARRLCYDSDPTLTRVVEHYSPAAAAREESIQ